MGYLSLILYLREGTSLGGETIRVKGRNDQVNFRGETTRGEMTRRWFEGKTPCYPPFCRNNFVLVVKLLHR